MNIKIRKTLLNDLKITDEIIYQNWVKFFPNKKYNITKKFIVDSWGDRGEMLKRIQKHFKNKKTNRRSYVIEVDGVIVGVCTYYLHKDANEINAIYIDYKEHNKGYGGILMQKVLKQIGRNKPVFLDTPIYQKASIGFYKKHGFKIDNKAFPNHIHNRKIPTVRLVYEKRSS